MMQAAASLGLVTYPTSDMSRRIKVVRHEARLRRLKKAVVTSARLLASSKGRPAMVTLTYRPGAEWDVRHIALLMKHVRQWLDRRGATARYVWVLELTKAGVPHYHVLLWLPRGMTIPKPDKQGWWPHGSTRVEWARKAVGYLSKYASKGCEPGDIPRGARLHGAGGLDAVQRGEKIWWMRPAWLREVTRMGERVARQAGGVRVSVESGEWWRTPWELVARAKNWEWVELEEHRGELAI